MLATSIARLWEVEGDHMSYIALVLSENIFSCIERFGYICLPKEILFPIKVTIYHLNVSAFVLKSLKLVFRSIF